MEWPRYVQQLLSGDRGAVPMYGGIAGPHLLMALQRFLLENTYAQLQAQHAMEIYQAAIDNDVQKNLTPSAVGAQGFADPAAGLAIEPPPSGWGSLESTLGG